MPRSIKMPSAEDIDKRYGDAIPRVAAAYKKGVEATTGFKEASLAGEANYNAVMASVISENRRTKGVAAMPDAAWKDGVVKKGVARIAGGMDMGRTKRRTNYEPIRAALNGMEIPDKGPDAVENARNIVPLVVGKMVEAKRARLGL